MRAPLNRETATAGALAWERACVESFIYHSAVVTLYDSELDLCDMLRKVQGKFRACLRPVPMPLAADVTGLRQYYLGSPTLGAPSEIFIFLIKGTQLARLARPLLLNEEITA